MIQFIQNNYISIIVTIIFVVSLLLLYKNNKKDIVKQILLSLVVQAEKALGSGTGELKYAWVVDNFYDKIPGIIKLLFTKKEIDTMIEDGVQRLKDILASGVTLNSYDDEIYIDVIKDDSIK